MNEESIDCPRCGGSCEVHVGQGSEGEMLIWNASCRCRECGDRREIDGGGLPPPEFRDLALAEAVHELVIEPAADTVSTLRRLQKILCMPETQVGPLGSRIPGAVIFGTAYEMEWLAGVLRSYEIPASVTQSDPDKDLDSLDLADLTPEDWYLSDAEPWSP